MKKSDGAMSLKKNSNYFYQVQGQLHITGKTSCYFILYAEKWMHVELIQRDDAFWQNNMVQKLTAFYLEALLPEIVSPRYTIRLNVSDIRDAPYVIKVRNVLGESFTIATRACTYD